MTVDDPEKEAHRGQNEFAGFVRNVGIDAMDHLAATVKSKSSSSSKTASAVRKMTAVWTKMSAEEKQAFMDRVIMAGQALAMAVPAAVAATKAIRDKKSHARTTKRKSGEIAEAQSAGLNEDLPDKEARRSGRGKTSRKTTKGK